jgi:hypothetical protein
LSVAKLRNERPSRLQACIADGIRLAEEGL